MRSTIHVPLIDPRGHHLLPYDFHRQEVARFERETGIEVKVRIDRNGDRRVRFADRKTEMTVLKMMQRVEIALAPSNRRDAA